MYKCTQEGLFSPSYSSLSTVEEYKDACTKPLRLAREMIEPSNPADPFILCKETGIDLTPNGNPHDSPCCKQPAQYDAELKAAHRILDAKLVRGGRYIVVLRPGCLTMWDLQDGAGSPRICGAHAVHHDALRLDEVRVDRTKTQTLHILMHYRRFFDPYP